jgi:hypothetical protein
MLRVNPPLRKGVRFPPLEGFILLVPIYPELCQGIRQSEKGLTLKGG